MLGDAKVVLQETDFSVRRHQGLQPGLMCTLPGEDFSPGTKIATAVIRLHSWRSTMPLPHAAGRKTEAEKVEPSPRL